MRIDRKDALGSGEAIERMAAADAPQHVLAALEVLRFDFTSRDRLRHFTICQWHSLLQWSDARQLTFILAELCADSIPPFVAEEIAARREQYALRFARLKRDLFEIAQAFDEANLTFALLKGLSHSPALTSNALTRAQGDIDLWLTGESVYKAKEVLSHLRYIPSTTAKSRHLSPMARPSKWKWRGDYFDPEMPISVELHYELWSEQAEHIAAPGLGDFWHRKHGRSFDGHEINVLCAQDLVGFAALHLLLHLLHGELPLQRAWEIANFLHTHSNDDKFWNLWRKLHPGALRQLESLTFQLVTVWFGCKWPQALDPDIEALPPAVSLWLKHFSLSPLKNIFHPNKDELWLHLALIARPTAKVSVLMRRLFPFHVPCYGARYSMQSSARAGLRKRDRTRLLISRLVRHACTFFSSIVQGFRWMRLRHLSREAL